ncbi:MAG: hypothetical protein JKX98_01850 [Alcanivoracaceae bacterium]|nr:hypothetical protein [Alcanivoracaceae bacterium]
MGRKVSDAANQLPLNFKQGRNKSFKDFVVADNVALIDSLQSFSQSPESLFFLWGESGSGKSHLLQAFVENLNDRNKSAVILTFEEISLRQNISLIEMFDYICIDQVEKITADKLLEESLFLWINEVRQAQKKIILASQISNNSEKWQLPDLRSRLQWGRTHQVKALDRDEVLQVFLSQAQQKGIVIDERVGLYLKNNCPMNMNFLSQLVNKLDEETLIHKKTVTIPLLKKILANN